MAGVIVRGGLEEDGDPVELRWTDGEISGDPVALARLDYAMEHPRRVTMTPTGPFYSTNDARVDGWAFVATALSLLADASYSQHGLEPYAQPLGDDTVS